MEKAEVLQQILGLVAFFWMGESTQCFVFSSLQVGCKYLFCVLYAVEFGWFRVSTRLAMLASHLGSYRGAKLCT